MKGKDEQHNEVKLNHNIYTCSVCKGIFQNNPDWNDEKALIQFRKNFPDSLDCVLQEVCESCYMRVKELVDLGLISKIRKDINEII